MTIQLEDYHANPQDYYLAFDLHVASILFTLKYELVTIDKSFPKKAQFIFKRREGIDLDIKRYWDNQLNLDARSLLENTKMLKTRVHSV